MCKFEADRYFPVALSLIGFRVVTGGIYDPIGWSERGIQSADTRTAQKVKT